MHPNAPPAHVKSSSVPSSPPPFVTPPWDKDLLSAQAAHAAAEAMSEKKPPSNPSKLKGVFGKRSKKKKNAVVAGVVPTTPSMTSVSSHAHAPHVLSTGKPLRPALVVRRSHRAPSIRSVKRAPSIRAPSIRAPSIRHGRAPSQQQPQEACFGHNRKISTEQGGQGRTSLERSGTIVRHHREYMGPGRAPKRMTPGRILTAATSRSIEEYECIAKSSPPTPRVLPIITRCSPPIDPLATLTPTSSYGSQSSGSDSASESASSTSTVDPGYNTPKRRLSVHTDVPRRHSADQAMPGMGHFLGSPGSSTVYSNSGSSSNASSTYYSGTSSPTVSSSHGNGHKMYSFPPQQQQQQMPQFRGFQHHHPMPDQYQYNVHQQMMPSSPPPSHQHQQQFNQAYPPPSHYQFHQFAGLQQQQQQQQQQGQYTYTYPTQGALPLLHFPHPLQPPTPEYYHPMPHRMTSPPQGLIRPFHFPAPQYPVGGSYQAPITHRPQSRPSSPGPARAISRPVTPSHTSVCEGQGRTRTVEFAAQLSVHQTWAADQYDRSSDPHITAQRLTPAIAHKIKLELNQFKSQEMLVHHESRVNTHFFV
ncbi:hypothetical protein BG005_009373 [Podila minutissima]|nr:hypothetical protein BG005_009373 [Podila minutissima]